MSKILRNRAKCALCDDVIESMSRHDFVKCKCGEIFVDGGHEYLRAGANDFENFIGMYETEPVGVVVEVEKPPAKKRRAAKRQKGAR